jgi:pSer/pThr/pTyr-binding forkhead associated (FHA) protein
MSQSGDDNAAKSTRHGGVPVYMVKKGAKPAGLRLIKGPGAPKTFALELEEVFVGRGLDAHITIDSESVSRRHARVYRSEDAFACEDLGSSNGLFINGERTTGKTLADGDTLQIGDALFVYDAPR